MTLPSADEWRERAHKRVLLFGMSGLGKTYLSNTLRDSGAWYHYSVDYRIGTRYMGEHIVDNFKREAMKNPFLADLLLSDSIYIGSNITFNNLTPLSTYLGKPGDPARGGLSFAEYKRRQAQHRDAEIAALLDAGQFIDRASTIYNYRHFVCDTGGSICEVVDPWDERDPVLVALSAATLMIWIEDTRDHRDELIARFDKAPKPMYYHPDFLENLWSEYRETHRVSEPQVDPDDFIRWSYSRALAHRSPIYKAMADNWGITIQARDVAEIRTPEDFDDLIVSTLAGREG